MPKIVDHEAKRIAIAQAVWRVVADRGIDGVTMREVAQAAGCSTGVLVHYFRGKDDLLLYALRLASQQTGARMAEHASRGPTLETLRAVVYESLPLDAERRQEWHVWVSFWGRAVASAELRAEHRRRYDEWLSVLRDLLTAMHERGRLRADCDPAAEAHTLAALIDGIGMQVVLDPDRLPPERQRTMIDAALERLAPADPAAA